MLRTLPLSTSSSSFCHVGYGSAVKASSTSLFVPFLKAIGLIAGAHQECPLLGYRAHLPVDEVKIHIIRLKTGETLVEHTFDLLWFMVIVPKLVEAREVS